MGKLPIQIDIFGNRRIDPVGIPFLKTEAEEFGMERNKKAEHKKQPKAIMLKPYFIKADRENHVPSIG